ncbi:hypothetical protein HNV08_00425 [Winogradskyella eckloniae]|uniref:hypothetical protein n=1 Tax=Winogradskyella eckloniae TaxID=1089306 RepID=UPI0015675757|nr:hypothetical protein [Winogradskyella eckloniae]NRD18494.1 hypothetical protein [Winogradskyella eckloniae]
MKHLKRVIFTLAVTVVLSTNFQCASSRVNSKQAAEPLSFKVKPIYYQEWNTITEEENSGINVFVPIEDKAENVVIDSIYFNNLKGQLVRNYGRYTAVLKNNSPNHTFENLDTSEEYPFTLQENECVIRYIENGKTKFHKVANVLEKERIQYEDGPPLAYQRRREAMIVSGEGSHLASVATFQESTAFKVKTISFQEWYAGIKIGGTGMNVFVPIVNKGDHIKIDSVYFRNLKAKLVEDSGRYTAVLKNKSPYYTFKKAEKDPDFPFTLEDNECAISFVENGEVKYVKVSDLNEKRGVYYENGPPKIYERQKRASSVTSIKSILMRTFLNGIKFKRNVLVQL